MKKKFLRKWLRQAARDHTGKWKKKLAENNCGRVWTISDWNAEINSIQQREKSKRDWKNENKTQLFIVSRKYHEKFL